MTTTYYEIKNNNNVFCGIVIFKSNEITVSIGGKVKGCVQFVIRREKQCEMERTGFDKRCNVDGNLMRSSGTITMLQSAISFIFQMFPNVNKIRLRDNSYVMCGDSTIFLPHLQLLEYGLTWYERVLFAELEDKSYKTIIQHYITIVTQKPIVQWDYLWNIIKMYDTRYEKELHKLWKTSKSIRDIIVYLKKNNNCDMFYKWIYGLFETITMNKVEIENIWYIINRNDTYNVLFTKLETNPSYIKSLETRKNIKELKYFGGFTTTNKLFPITRYF